MRIEFDYNIDTEARMTIDDEALKMILNYIAYDIRDLGEAEIIEMAQCIGEIANAIERIDQEKKKLDEEPEEKIVRCGECVFSEEEGGGIACTRTKDGIIRCELDYCSMGHLHEEDAE